MIIVLIICDRIIYLIVYLCDHFYDHLLTQSMTLYKAWLCGRDFVEPHKPVMVETGIVRQGFQGSLS